MRCNITRTTDVTRMEISNVTNMVRDNPSAPNVPAELLNALQRAQLGLNTAQREILMHLKREGTITEEQITWLRELETNLLLS